MAISTSLAALFAVACLAALVGAPQAPLAEGARSEANSAALKQIIDEARENCRSMDNGVFSYGEGAIHDVDVSGDGEPDVIVDSAGFNCTTAASFWCGTGGCLLSVVIDGEGYGFLTQGWEIVDLYNYRVLLLAVHGMECGGSNVRKCVRAEVWSEGAFRSPGRE